MIMQYRDEAIKYLIGGVVLSIVGSWVKNTIGSGSFFSPMGDLAVLAGPFVFIYGCILFAKAKGYEWYVGLLGIFNVVGLIILYLLKDKS